MELSGDVVGGGDDTSEEHVEELLQTGELVSDRAEMVVLGDSVTLVSQGSTGNTDTPSSVVWGMGLKILFLLFAR